MRTRVGSSAQFGDGAIPICDVLVIYARIEPDGAIHNALHTLREIVHKSHAPIVVVATENDSQSYTLQQASVLDWVKRI